MAEPCDLRHDVAGAKRRVLVRDLNPHITCSLCEGYLIDATAINECLHTFCRSCIVRYLESSKYCPTCDILVHKNKPLSALKPDRIIQLLVYKLIPSVYQNEVKRRAEFYTNARASSSCSEDSILTDSHTETPEESIFSHIQTSVSDFFSPDDSISLSLEYYNEDVDAATRQSDINMILDGQDGGKYEQNNNEDGSKPDGTSTQDKNENIVHKRYLQCPAGVNIKHLSKFIRMKYGLSFHHRVDIIYEGEILPKYFTLMDVAYTFKYKRSDPMRFMYRIFESPPPSRKPQPHEQQTPLTPSPDSSPKSSGQTDRCEPSNADAGPDRPDGKTEPDEKRTNVEEEKRCEEADQRQQRQRVTNDEFDDDDIREFAKKRDLEWANLIRQQREECDEKRGDEEDEDSCEEFETMEMSKLRSGGGMRRVEVRRNSSGANHEKGKSIAGSETKKHDGNKKKSFHEKETFYGKGAEKYGEDETDVEPARRYSADSNERSGRKGSGRHYGDPDRISKHVYKKSLGEGKNDDPVYFRRSESKKRKKSKHSRHADAPKRRRLHAEIQNQFEKEDVLKLKVKLTPPSVQKVHKHRHSDESPGGACASSEMSAKERLLQMRQVRHKNIQSVQQEVPSTSERKSPDRPVAEGADDGTGRPNADSSKKVRFEVEQDERPDSPERDAEKEPPAPKREPVAAPDAHAVVPVAKPASPQRKCVPNLIAPNSFTVSKIVSGEKRRAESPDRFADPKVPSLEITLIGPTPQKQFVPTSNIVPNKNYPPAGPGLSKQPAKQTVAKNVNAVKPVPKASNPVQKTVQPAQPHAPHPAGPGKPKSVPNKPEQIKPVQRVLNPTGIGTGQSNGNPTVSRTQQIQKPGSTNQQGPRQPVPQLLTKTGPSGSQLHKPVSQLMKKSPAGTGKPTIGPIKPAVGPSKPPPATIPLSKIKKLAAGLVGQDPKDAKASQRVDNFGALDLSDKSSRLAGPVADADGKQDAEPGKETKDPQKSHFSNLHILSESAVRIRDLMVSAQNKNMSGLFGPKLLAKLESHKNKLALAQAQALKDEKKAATGGQGVQPAPKIENKPIVVLSPKIQMQQMTKKDATAPRSVEPTVGKTEPTKEPVPKVSVSPVTGAISPTVQSKMMSLVANPRVPSPKSTIGGASKVAAGLKGHETAPGPVVQAPVAKSAVPALSQQAIKCVQQANNPGPKPAGASGCPPIPNLQMLKIPVLQNSKSLEAQMKSLQKMPKLQEISKLGHFGNVAQIRGTPNQAVRNIPNPSALMARQHQIQNRQGGGGATATSNGSACSETNGSDGVTTSAGDEQTGATTKAGPDGGPAPVAATGETKTES